MVGKGGGGFIGFLCSLVSWWTGNYRVGEFTHLPSLCSPPPLSFSHTPLALYSIDVYRCLGENHIGPTAEACTVL